MSGLGRPYWTYWVSAVLTNLGDGIRLAAFPLLAAQLTTEPALVGAVAAAGGIPWLLTGLLAGSTVDRFGARWLLPVTDLARLVVLSALVVFLVTDRASIGVAIGAAFLLGVCETFRDTAAETIVPRLVLEDQLERAGGRLTAGVVVGNEFAGPLLGGVLFGAGAALPFVANGAVTAFAVLLLASLPGAALRLMGSAPAVEDSAAGGIRAGFTWLRGRSTLRSLVIVVTLVALADSGWFAIFVLYAEQALNLTPSGFGALIAIGAGGGLTGALLADRVVAGRGHVSVIGWSAAAATMTPMSLLLLPRVWVAVIVIVATSAAFGVLNVAAAGMRYRMVPHGLLGRVSAVWRTSANAASAAGAIAGGVIADVAGLDAPFLLSLVVGAVAVSVWLATPRMAVRSA